MGDIGTSGKKKEKKRQRALSGCDNSKSDNKRGFGDLETIIMISMLLKKKKKRKTGKA